MPAATGIPPRRTRRPAPDRPRTYTCATGKTPTTDTIRSGRLVRQSGSGVLHGLAGTGAVVVLLLAALPSQLEAGLALAVFAPMSIVSMALCTAVFGWLLTRPVIEPLYRTVLIPALGVFGVTFGLWYTGLV